MPRFAPLSESGEQHREAGKPIVVAGGRGGGSGPNFARARIFAALPPNLSRWPLPAQLSEGVEEQQGAGSHVAARRRVAGPATSASEHQPAALLGFAHHNARATRSNSRQSLPRCLPQDRKHGRWGDNNRDKINGKMQQR